MDEKVQDLITRGWAFVPLSGFELNMEEEDAVNRWEEVFDNAFSLDIAEKEAAGKYRTENGVSVGYRIDCEREFFESRLLSTGLPEPNFPSQPDYAATIVGIYSALNKVAYLLLDNIAAHMGIDPKFFLDLTDIECNGVLPHVEVKNKQSGEVEMKADLSSALLRICKYSTISEYKEEGGENASINSTWFGAHTDSSFLTVALCSSTPGLDIVDQLTNEWVCPELMMRTSSKADAPLELQQHTANVENADLRQKPAGVRAPGVVVFVGEFLQVLSKNRFKAAVHRVRNFGIGARVSERQSNTAAVNNAECSANIELSATNTKSSDEIDNTRNTEQQQKKKILHDAAAIPNVRISCPYLIRGRHGAVLDLHNTARYNHPGGVAAVDERSMPNLDGTSVRMLHKLLDLKRQKCFRDNGSAEGPWVLSAYPVPPLPPDNII